MTKPSTKDKILNAAADLMESKGLAAVTQNAVAKIIGISQGQLTYHFPKRIDLIMSATDLAVNRVAEFIFKAIDLENPSNEKKVNELLWNLIENHSRCRVLLGLLSESETNPEVKEKFQRQYDQARMLIAYTLKAEPEDYQVTKAYALLLGYGILSYVKGQNDKKLKEDFMQTMAEFKKQKSSKRTKND